MIEKLNTIKTILTDIAIRKPTGSSPEPIERALAMIRFVDDKSREALPLIEQVIQEWKDEHK